MDARAAIERAGGLMSLADVARDADVSHSAARKWRERADWPKPVGVIAKDTAQPVEVFLVSDVRKWHGGRYRRETQ